MSPLVNWLKRTFGVSSRWARRRKGFAPSRPLHIEALEERNLFAIATWDGGGTTNNWSDAANWVGDVGPVQGDSLVFDGTTRLTSNNDLAANNIFQSIAFKTAGFNVTGNAITLTSGITSYQTAGSNSIALNIALAQNQFFVSSNEGATLQFTGNIDTGTLINLTFDGQGTFNFTNSSTITGSGGFTKNGDGTLILRGNNSFEGEVYVAQGVVQLAHNNALGATTGRTLIGNGPAAVNGVSGSSIWIDGSAGALTIGENFLLSEGGISFGSGSSADEIGSLRNIAGNNTLTGGIDIGGTTVVGVNTGTRLTVTGQVSAPTSTTNQFVKAGGGALQLGGSQSNIIRGTTTVLQGTLELNKTGGAQALYGALTVGDSQAGDNTATVLWLGNNQVAELDLYNTAINAVTLNAGGVLNLNNFTDILGTLTLTVGQTYSSDVTMGGTGTLATLGAITVNAFQGSSGVSPAATIANGTLNLDPLFSGGAALTHKVITVNDTQLNNVAADLVISANITGGAGVQFEKNGGGTLRLSGNNTYSGNTVLTTGIVEVGSDTAFGTGLLSFAGVTLSAFGGNRTVSNSLSLDNTLNTFGPNNLTFNGNMLLTGDRTIQVMDLNQTVTFNGVIEEGVFGARILNKSGRGMLVYNGANTFSGTITVNDDGGTLVLGGNGSILNVRQITVGQGSVLRLDNSVTNLANRIDDTALVLLSNGRLELIGQNNTAVREVIGELSINGSTSSTVVSQVGTGSSTNQLLAHRLVANGQASVNFVGVGAAITANGSNRISFVGNMPGPLNGAYPFARVERWTDLTGTTILSTDFATIESTAAGFDIIALPAAGYVTDFALAGPTSNLRLGPGTYTLNNTLRINSLILDGDVIINGPGSLEVTSGGILFNGNGVIDTGYLNLAISNGNNAFITVQPGFNATIRSPIGVSPVALTKSGTGRLILEGDNQFGGNMLVNEGIVTVRHSRALGATGVGTFVRQGATLELDGSLGNLDIQFENLDLRGVGFSPDGTYANAIGAIRNVAGDNIFRGTVSQQGNATDLTAMLGGFPVIANGTTFYQIEAGTSLNLAGAVNNNQELIKRGAGTLILSGPVANGYNAATRILEGTLQLAKQPGVLAIQGNSYFVGTNLPGAPSATLRLSSSDMLPDGSAIQVEGSGNLVVDPGVAEVFGALNLTIAANGAADVVLGAGSLLTPNGNIQVFTAGTGHAAGTTITGGGTLALQVFGVQSGAGQRTWQANDGAVGDDLTVDTTVVDGTGLQSVGILKSGFGTLVLGGSTSNTFTGTTSVNEGTLALAKTGGAQAMTGPISVGDNNVQSGFAGSDILEYRGNDQLPDWLVPVTVNGTGLINLNGFSDTIGNVDLQNALVINGGRVNLGGGTLTLNGDLFLQSNFGAGGWTADTTPSIDNGTLNLGNTLVRTINVADRSGKLVDARISANIVAPAGIRRIGTGMLHLSGDNSGVTGDWSLESTALALGSATALGTGSIYNAGTTTLLSYGTNRTVTNNFTYQDQLNLGVYNNIMFTGVMNAVRLDGGSNLNVTNLVEAEIAGTLGENFTAQQIAKNGTGILIISSPVYTSNTVTVNAGQIIIRGNGTMLNVGTFNVNAGASLIIDNSGTNLINRIGDLATITLSAGDLVFIGAAGTTSTEFVGTVNANAGNSPQFASAFIRSYSGVGGTNLFVIDNLARGGGGDLRLIGRGSNIGSATNQIYIGNAAALVSNILTWATMYSTANVVDFVTYTAVAGTTYRTLSAAASVTTPTLNSVVKLTGGGTVTLAAGVTTITALIIDNNTTLNLNGINLVITAGVIVGGNLTSNISALTISNGTLTLTTAGTTEGLIKTERNTTTTITAVISNTNSIRFERDGRTIINATNGGLTGTVVVNDGTVQLQNQAGFGGAGTGASTVNNFATLELAGTAFNFQDALSINGSGIANAGALRFLDSSVGVAQTNIWSGTVTLAGNAAVRVDGGGGTFDNLEITAALAGTAAFTKLGAGRLTFNGAVSNTLTGSVNVNEGTLFLNKAPTFVAIAGALNIGDNLGGNDADVVLLGAADQIADAQSVVVNASGLFNLGGFTEQITNLTLASAAAYSANVSTGNGILTMSGTVTVNALRGGINQAAVMDSSATGSINLGTALKTYVINDGTGIDELLVTANLIGTSTAGFDKQGTGRMVLNPITANTYTGFTQLTGGELVLKKDGALGVSDGALASGTYFVNTAASLLLDPTAGNLNLANEYIQVNTTVAGFNNQGMIRNVSGNNTWGTGATSFFFNAAATSTIAVDTGTSLDLNGTISQNGGNAGAITKIMPGTLRFSGTAANTYTGTTAVNEGILELNKTGAVAITGALVIGNDAGGDDVDVVRFLQNNQLATGTLVTIASSGLFDLNGFVQTLTLGAAGNSLTFSTAPTFGGSLDLKGGTLTLGQNANIAATVVAGTQTVAATKAEIRDSVGGGALALGAFNHVINVADQAFNLKEFEISALVTGGATDVIDKQGAGDLALTNDNVGLSGVVRLGGGRVMVQNDGAFGTATIDVDATSVLSTLGIAISLANAINLVSGDLTLRGDANLNLAGTVTMGSTTISTQNNRTLNVNMRQDRQARITNTGSLVLVNSNANSTAVLSNLTFNNIFFVDGQITDLGGSTNAGLQIQTTNVGAVEFSNNANNYIGATTVAGGILRLSANNALGATSGTTTVNGAASLHLAGEGMTFAENLILATNALGFILQTGALRNLAVDTNADDVFTENIWSGTIQLGTAASTNTIGVDSGTTSGGSPVFAASKLNISGVIGQNAANAGAMVKVGTGTLEYSGTAHNTYTGTTTIREGVMRLNMSGGANASGAAWDIGDQGGGTDGDQLIFVQNDQIVAGQTIQVISSGLLDFSTATMATRAMGAVNLFRMAGASGDIVIGAGQTALLGNNLQLAGTATYSDGTSAAATIRGAGTLAMTASRTFTTADSVIPNAGDDLIISVVIGQTAAGFTMTTGGFGTLVLTAQETFTGGFTINAAQFLGGATTQIGGTVILRGAGSVNLAAGTTTVQAGASLVLDNRNASGGIADRLRDASALTINGGTLHVIGNESASVIENVGTVTIGAGASFNSTVRMETVGNTPTTNLVRLAGTSLARGGGGTVNFQSVGNDIGSLGLSEVVFGGTPAGIVNGILPYAILTRTTGETEFVQHTDIDPGAGVVNSINAAPFVLVNNSGDLGAAAITANVKIAGAATIAAPKTVNAMMFVGGSIESSGNMITVTSGQVVAATGTGAITDAVFGTSQLRFGGTGTAEGLFTILDGASLTINTDVIGTGAVRKEGNGTLTFAGDANTYTSTLTINRGSFVARNATAFGTTAAGTTVNVLAQLVLDASATGTMTVGDEALTIVDSGITYNPAGSLRAFGGTTVWGTSGTVTINIGGAQNIAVAGGSSSLTLNGTLSNTAVLRKWGDGTLVLAGTVNNAAFPTEIYEGTLVVNKSAAAIALNSSVNINADFAGTATLQYASGTGTNQIVDTQTVTVQSGGTLDLNGNSDQITNLTMSGGRVLTGAGTLTWTGTYTYNQGSQAVLSGNFNLGTAAGLRPFNINDGAFVDDVVFVGATNTFGLPASVISGPGGIQKQGIGTLRLDGANTFTGASRLDAGVLALGDDLALSTTVVNLTNNADNTNIVIRSSGGDRTIANNIVFDYRATNTSANVTNRNLQLGGLQNDPADDLTFTGDVLLQNGIGTSSPNYTGFTIDVLNTTALFSGVISENAATANGAAITKNNIGTLVLTGSAPNTYTGTTTINGGIVTALKSGAFGTGTVNIGILGQVEVGNGSVQANALTLPGNGAGFLNQTGRESTFFGALRSVAGGGTWGTGATTITLNGANGNLDWVGAEAGSTLTLNGTIGQQIANINLRKVGEGTVVLGGNAANNTYAGTTVILAGTLALNKGGGFNAINGGTIFVGDNLGTDILELRADEQIGDALGVNLAASGQLLFAGSTLETVVISTMVIGETSSSIIDTGSGQLNLNGDLTVNVRPGMTTAAPPAALIAGNVGLRSAAAAATTRTITVNDARGDIDLSITANLLNSGASADAALTKAGAGRMFLSGSNDFSGTTTVNGGALRVQGSSALGGTSNGTVVNAGFALEFDGAATTDEALSLNGRGLFNGDVQYIFGLASGTGALRHLGGGNLTLNGAVAIVTNDTTIDTGDTGAVILNGVVSGTLNLMKRGAATLELGGGAANTLSSRFVVNEGTLRLNKSAGVAIAGILIIGDNRGGDNVDIVEIAPGGVTDQIGNVTVHVSSSGRFNLFDSDSSATEAIGALELQVGNTFSGDLRTGTGTLILGGDLVARIRGGIDYTSPSATVGGTDGNLSLGTLNLGANRNFLVHEGRRVQTLANRLDVQNVEELSVYNVIEGPAFTLNKTGRGGLAINGSANTYTGTTTVAADGGTLGGTGSITNSPSLTVSRFGELDAGARLTSSVEDFSVPGLVISALGSLTVEINGTTPVTEYDQIVVTGTVNVTGANLNVVIDPGFTPNAGDVFVLVVNDGTDAVTGTFGLLNANIVVGGVVEGSQVLVNGVAYTVTYRYDSVSNTENIGNDIALIRNRIPTISSATLTLTAINEGGSTTLTILFNDPDLGESHTVNIDWNGDGTVDETVVAPPSGLTTRTVIVTTPVYVNDGPDPGVYNAVPKEVRSQPSDGIPVDIYNIRVFISDAEGNTSATLTAPLTVNNVAPTLTSIIGQTITEQNNASVSFVINDPGRFDTFTVNVNWNDSNDPTPTTATGLAFGVNSSGTGWLWNGTTRVFTATHFFGDDGPAPGNGTSADTYTVGITVTDSDTGTTNNSATVIVQNVAPTISNVTGPQTIDENGTATVSFNINDQGLLDRFNATVNWGDGSSTLATGLEFGVISSGTDWSWDGALLTTFHQFTDDGPSPGNNTASDLYTVAITVSDDDTGTATASAFVTVNNLSPTIANLTGAQTINEGDTATISFNLDDVGTQDVLTVTVNWGDPNSSPLVVTGLTLQADASGANWTWNATTRLFTATHAYEDDGAAPGNGTASDLASISVTVADDDTNSASSSTSVTINNVGPQITNLTAPTVITENDLVTVSFVIVDPGRLDRFTINLTWGDPNNAAAINVAGISALASASGADWTWDAITKTFTATRRYLDDGLAPGNGTPFDVSTISISIADDDTGTASTTSNLTVNNAGPVLGTLSSSTTPLIPGTPQTITVQFTDAGTLDVHSGANMSFVRVSPGSPAISGSVVGVITEPSGSTPGTMSFTTTFMDIGVYQFTFTLSDDDGATTTQVVFLEVKSAGIGDDPNRPGKTALFIAGTSLDDYITVSQTVYNAATGATTVTVSVNNVVQGNFTFTGGIYARGNDGNDRILLNNNVKVPAMIWGGNGADTLQGGASDDVLVGEAGNDKLYGGWDGRDVLIGGTGSDYLEGQTASNTQATKRGDILIGGYTSYDSQVDALFEIYSRWNPNPANLTAFNTTLNTMRTTGISALRVATVGQSVFDDNAVDQLVGSAGRDWYFARVGQDTHNRAATDALDNPFTHGITAPTS